MKIISYISLVLWSIYIMLSIYRTIRSKKNIKDIFYYFRIDNLFFLGIYLFYNYKVRDEVLPYLYLIIIITLIVYILYDILDNKEVKKLKKKEYNYFILGIILIIGLFIYYNISKSIYRVNTLSLIINLFLPLIIKLRKKN